MASAYDMMMRGGSNLGATEILGGPEILGDPATQIPTAADQDITKYIDAGWTASDKTLMGLGDGTVLLAGTEALFQVQTQTPFKVLQITQASQYVPDLVLVQCKIGSVDLVEGFPIPMEMFSEVSNNAKVSWPTLDTSQSVSMRIRNRGAVDVRIDIGFYGIRLRK